MPQVFTTVGHKTEYDGWEVASSGLHGLLRRGGTVNLALSKYSSAELPVCMTAHPCLLVSTILYPHTHFRDTSWLICAKMFLSLELEHGENIFEGFSIWPHIQDFTLYGAVRSHVPPAVNHSWIFFLSWVLKSSVSYKAHFQCKVTWKPNLYLEAQDFQSANRVSLISNT